MKQIVKIKTSYGDIILSCESYYSENSVNNIDNLEMINVPIKYNSWDVWI